MHTIEGGVEIIATDSGPGMENVGLALQDHFSTDPRSMGMGLPGVRRLMDVFEIETSPGKGTRVVTSLRRLGKYQAVYDRYFIAKRPKTYDNARGDTAVVREFDNKLFIGVLDVLGSGVAAHEQAKVCEAFLAKHIHGKMKESMAEIVQGLHHHIQGSRGVVAALCQLEQDTGLLRYADVGDVTARVFGADSKRLVFRSGIIGYNIETPRNETLQLSSGDVLLVATDGVRFHFNLEDYPRLLTDDTKTIATHVINNFIKPADDALCVVTRYQR